MITFIIAIILLLLGYFLYSKFIERILEIDPQRPTPAVAHPDGVDFVPMKSWRIHLIRGGTVIYRYITNLFPSIPAKMHHTHHHTHRHRYKQQHQQHNHFQRIMTQLVKS